MDNIIQKIEEIDWQTVTEAIHENGYAIIPGLVSAPDCEMLKSAYDSTLPYRKTVIMERHRFGMGVYKYFNYPLPELIHSLRTTIYSKLAPIANAWFRALNLETQFPLEHTKLLELCHKNGQQKLLY